MKLFRGYLCEVSQRWMSLMVKRSGRLMEGSRFLAWQYLPLCLKAIFQILSVRSKRTHVC